MAQLAEAVSATEVLWRVDSIPPERFLRVESELVEVATRYPMKSLIRVRRGQEGTTAASHADETTLTPVYLGMSDQSGGGGVSLEVTTFNFDTAGFINPADNGIEVGTYAVGSLLEVSLHYVTYWDEACEIIAAMCANAADGAPESIGFWRNGVIAAGPGYGREVESEEASLFELSRSLRRKAIVTAGKDKLFLVAYPDGGPPTRGQLTLAVSVVVPA